MKTKDKCPKCKVDWKEEETIYEHFLRLGYSENDARVSAAMYGCTPETPKHFNKNVVGVETPDYDEVSEWLCLECNSRFNRWTMQVI